MNKYHPDLHHRRSIRLRGYNYSQEGLYFVTICTQRHASLFGEMVNGEMRRNEMGKMVEQCWLAIPLHYPNVALHNHIVMPNHFHGIIEITKSFDGTVGANNHSPVHSPVHSFNHNGANNHSPVHSPNHSFNHNGANNHSPVHPPNHSFNHNGANDYSPVHPPNHPFNHNGANNYSPVHPPNHSFNHNGANDYSPVHSPNHPFNHNGANDYSPLRSPKHPNGTSRTIGAIVRGFKIGTAKNIGYSVWQRNYHEHVIRNAADYARIADYIAHNPANWDTDCFYTELFPPYDLKK